MLAGERKPSAWKADGRRFETKEGWAKCPAFLNVYVFWSGKRDSNPRPSAWEADALPTELFPLDDHSMIASLDLSTQSNASRRRLKAELELLIHVRFPQIMFT